MQQAGEWLLSRETRVVGDWYYKTKHRPPGGWYFEHHNEFYPDVDDTAMVLIALKEVQESGVRGQESGDRSQFVSNLKSQISNPNSQIPNPKSQIDSACDRARRWMLAMQNRDGGWGAFDKDNDSEFLCRVPFADHNAMIDPSTPDLTGRVL